MVGYERKTGEMIDGPDGCPYQIEIAWAYLKHISKTT
jgi:hypothetical protein